MTEHDAGVHHPYGRSSRGKLAPTPRELLAACVIAATQHATAGRIKRRQLFFSSRKHRRRAGSAQTGNVGAARSKAAKITENDPRRAGSAAKSEEIYL